MGLNWAEYILENVKICSYFPSFHNTDIAQVAEILPIGSQVPLDLA